MTDYMQFIMLSRYSRWVEKDKRRETWEEVVDRYLDYLLKAVEESTGKSVEKYRKELRHSILNLEVLPSMRAAMMAGPALERCNVGAYNCSYLPVDHPRSFDETMYILMCGTGVGFSVERQYVSQLPSVNEHFEDTKTTVVVEDTRAGWAKGLRELISLLFSGQVPSWDLSKLRPAGARLKTSGGRSSGPEPLNELFHFTVGLFKRAQGRRLTSLECHDLMCKIGEVVVVGGVRRSALISLSNLSDERMRDAKAGQWWIENGQRALANNSVCYTEKPDTAVFMKEWLALYQSKSGERGIFNRMAATKQAQKNNRRETKDQSYGTNPCQPGFATLLTKDGIQTFDDITVGSVIWSGRQWTQVTNKVMTGIKPVYKYHTNAGYFLGTENHRIVQDSIKIEVKDADGIDVATGPIKKFYDQTWSDQDVVDGWVLGDGSVHKASNDLVYLCLGENDGIFHDVFPHLVLADRRKAFSGGWEVNTTISAEELPKTYDRIVPARFKFGNEDKVRGFLRGLYAANGSVVGKRVTLKASSYQIIEDAREMLSSLGITSYVTTNKSHVVEFSNGEYSCKESYDLNISKDKPLFESIIGFIHKHKEKKLLEALGPQSTKRKVTYDVTEVEFVGDLPVYDITVDAEEHTYWTGGCLVSNCSEIILRPYQFCNLSEVVVREHDTEKTLIQKVRLATIIGTFQSCLTDFKYLRAVWKKNTEEERLLGVSLTGILDNPGMLDGSVSLAKLRTTAIDVNKELSKDIGIPQSVGITCVKPSGTVSQLVDSASGIHPRWSRWYIRSVRGDNKDPITKLLKDQGVPHEPDHTSPHHVTVFSFPQKAPKSSLTRYDVSALDHLNIWKRFQDEWCEHKPSITVNVKEHEWLRVQSWVWDNFDQVSGIAFLPFSDHTYQQAPYQEMTEEQYDDVMKKFPRLDWSKLSDYEKEDQTVGTQTLACTGDSCEIVDLV